MSIHRLHRQRSVSRAEKGRHKSVRQKAQVRSEEDETGGGWKDQGA